VAVLAAVVHESPRREPVRGGYRVLLRDRAFLHLAVADVAMIAVGWGVFSWLLPPFARNQIGLSTSLIGLLLLANAMAVVVAQVPVARFAEGRRRALTMALAGALFCGACLLVEVADATRAIAYAILIAAVIVAGVGECLHTTALTPLVAELAPVHLRGRYMAVAGLCFWIGLAAAPTGGTALLSVSPTAAFGVAAGVALAAAVSMLRLERRLPEAARLTPRPRR
jgi:MFS family permease